MPKALRVARALRRERDALRLAKKMLKLLSKTAYFEPATRNSFELAEDIMYEQVGVFLDENRLPEPVGIIFDRLVNDASRGITEAVRQGECLTDAARIDFIDNYIPVIDQ